MQGETFAAQARANQIQVIPVAAPRGLIVDRHGVVLVRSRPSFVCALIPSEVTDIDKTLARLSDVLGDPRRKAAPPAAAPSRQELRRLRAGADVRAVRPGDPRDRSHAGADGAARRSAERSARRRHGRAAGAQLSVRQSGSAPVRLRRRRSTRTSTSARKRERLLAQRRHRQGRARERVRPLAARPRRRRAGRGRTRPARWCAGSSRSIPFPATRS